MRIAGTSPHARLHATEIGVRDHTLKRTCTAQLGHLGASFRTRHPGWFAPFCA